MRNRMAQAVSSIKTSALASVADLATVGSYLLGTVKNVLGSKEVLSTVRETTLQTVEGMSPTTMAALPKASLRYPQSQEVIWSTLWKGAVSYAIPAIAYRGVIRPLVSNAVDGTYVQYPFYVADAVANLYLVRAGANLTLDMIFYGLGISKTTTPAPEEFKRDHDSLVPCPEACGGLANLQASLMMQLNSFAALKAVQLTDYTVSTLFLSFKQPVVPIIGSMVAYPFLRLIEGRLLVGYKLASVGMCTTHREDILSANNGYCLGKGISYDLTLRLLNVLTTESIRYLAWYAAGIDIPSVSGLLSNDLFVSDALAYLVWLSFTVAETQVNNALPGKKRGWEIFYLPNLAVREGISFLIDKVTQAFKAKKTEESSAIVSPVGDVNRVKEDKALDFTWAAPVLGFFKSEPVRMLLTLINSDLLSLEKFLKRRSVGHFSRIYGDAFHENINWFKNLRKGRVPRFILELVPEAYVSNSSKQILLTLRKKHWDGPVAYVEQAIHQIFPTEFSHLPHVDSAPLLSEARQIEAREKSEADQEEVSVLRLAQQSAGVLSHRHVVPPSDTVKIGGSPIVLLKSPVKKTVVTREAAVLDEEGSRMSEAARRMLAKNRED